MGAQPTFKVQKFLSYYDIWPAPLIKEGSKTIYKKEEKVTVDSQGLNPYNINKFKEFLGKVLEQEENSYMYRLILAQNEVMKESFVGNQKKDESLLLEDPSKIKEEIEKLKLQLKEFRINSKGIDGVRRDLILRRVNYLFQCLVNAERNKAFKQNIDKSGDNSVNKDNIKLKLMHARFEQKLTLDQQQVQDKIAMMQPITREEFKEYIVANTNLTDAKAEILTRQTFRKEKETGIPVTKQDVLEICQKSIEINNPQEISMKAKTLDQNVFIPITKPITPFPNLKTYDPEEYYDIPKIVDQISIQNKSYSLPNINDMYLPKRPQRMNSSIKQVSGRKRPKRVTWHSQSIVYEYCTQKSVEPSKIFKGAYISYLDYLNFKKTFKSTE